MSLMPSLCAALERAGGERLVMRAGERPHVLAGERRHDVASAILSVNAVEALAEQILSPTGRDELATNGTVNEMVEASSFPHPLVARAERVGDDFCIELIVSLPNPEDAPSTGECALVADVGTASLEPVTAEQTFDTGATAPHGISHSIVLPDESRPTDVPTADVTVVARVEEPVRRDQMITSESDSARLWTWIHQAGALGATTLYLRSGSPAAARIDDRIQLIGGDVVPPSIIEAAHASFGRGGDGIWESRPDGEWAREDEDGGYVRCRSFSDLQGPGLVVQLQPSSSFKLLYKHIPRAIRTACEGNGLVLVAASSEAEVEALAAAVADWSGRERGGYLISLQRRKPQEYLSGAFVSHRALDGNESEFALAIGRAAQEGPDILLVTGVDSEQSLRSAVLAAAGGRLVIVGLVARTTVDALRRLASPDSNVRRALAASFRGAIGYRSLRRLGGGRTLVRDLVLANTAVCDLLEQGDFDRLRQTQRSGLPGMRSVDESLARGVTRHQISLRDAVSHAVDADHLVRLVRRARRSDANSTANARSAYHARAREDHGEVGAVSGVLGEASRF